VKTKTTFITVLLVVTLYKQAHPKLLEFTSLLIMELLHSCYT